MTALTYCMECDTTVDVDDDHFNDDGSCSYQDIRDVLTEFQEPDWEAVDIA